MSTAPPASWSWSTTGSRTSSLKGAWTGPATLDLRPHALAPIAELPVREILSATHLVADLTLGMGKVVYDYLED